MAIAQPPSRTARQIRRTERNKVRRRAKKAERAAAIREFLRPVLIERPDLRLTVPAMPYEDWIFIGTAEDAEDNLLASISKLRI